MKLKHMALVLFMGTSSTFGGIKEAHSKGPRLINDSLVRNLSCQNLSVDHIYAAIREDAFDESRNMPITNWGFQSGLASLAGCWALSSAQRMVSYLGRYYVKPSEQQAEIPQILDMVRGKRLVENIPVGSLHDVTPYSEYNLKAYSVFPVEEGSLAESAKFRTGLWSRLQTGYKQRLNFVNVDRKFKAEIEASQGRHFFRLRNLGMGLGSGVRDEDVNARTMNQIIRNLNGKRLTLINLRAAQTVQHIVMAKSYSFLNSNIITIKAYDSNQPSKDQLVYYDIKRKHFFAPEIIGKIEPTRASYAVGTFIVDEGEREPFEKALLAHYRQRCR